MACLGALAVLVSVTACSGVAADNAAAPRGPVIRAESGPTATAASQALYRKIQQEIGTAACNAPAQCKTLALGNKACGGPESYVAWSITASNAARLTQLGAEYAAARKEENTRGGMVSNCMAVMDPGATCSAGRCVTNQGGAALQ